MNAFFTTNHVQAVNEAVAAIYPTLKFYDAGGPRLLAPESAEEYRLLRNKLADDLGLDYHKVQTLMQLHMEAITTGKINPAARASSIFENRHAAFQSFVLVKKAKNAGWAVQSSEYKSHLETLAKQWGQAEGLDFVTFVVMTKEEWRNLDSGDGNWYFDEVPS